MTFDLLARSRPAPRQHADDHTADVGKSTLVQRQAVGPPPPQPAATNTSQLARQGVTGGAQPLPFLDKIQALFGRHSLVGVQAHIGGPAAHAADAIGAEAYATGSSVAFARAPDLRLAAHEAAHVIQQRAGVQLAGGVGRAGDDHEQHADAVAELVAHGRSAEALLDRYGGAGAAAAGAVQCFGAKPTSRDKDAWKAYLNEVIKELTEYVATCDPSKLNRPTVTTHVAARKLLGEIATKKDCAWFLSRSNPANLELEPLYDDLVVLKEQAQHIKQGHAVNKAIATTTARTLTSEETLALSSVDLSVRPLLSGNGAAADRIMQVLQHLVEIDEAKPAFVRYIGHVMAECVTYKDCMKGLEDHLVKISTQNDVSGYQGFMSELQTVCELAKAKKIDPSNKARIGKMIDRSNLWGKTDSNKQDIDVKYRNHLGQIELVEVKDQCKTLSKKMNIEIGSDAQLGRDPKDSRQLESLKVVRDEYKLGNCHLTFWCSQPAGWVRLLCSDHAQKLIASNCDLVISGHRYDPTALTVLRNKALKLVGTETTKGTVLDDAYWAVEKVHQHPELL